MALTHPSYKSTSGRILLLVLAISFSLCAGSANAASEPGTVTILMPSEPVNLDPGDSARNDVGKVIATNIVETLTEINRSEGKIVPRLATSWRQIDANTWHFILRKGVKFHDGADFNSEAVLFNIKRLYDKRIDNRLRANFFSNIKMEGKVIDSHTVELKLEKPEPLMPTLMGILTFASPNTLLDKSVRNPIGTGPYRFVKWDAGTQIILERFDGYWGKQPEVKKVVYIWRGESAVQAAMVEIGEADLAVQISKQNATRPDMDHSYLNYETLFLRMFGVWEPPLNDRRVRMALNYAVDRNTIRGSILSKDSLPATQIVLPSVFGYNPELKPWPYDPEKAKQLLDEARKDGVPVDKEILLVGRPTQFPGAAEVMEAVMTMYKAIGINMKLKSVESAVYATYRTKPFPKDLGPYMVQGQHDNSYGEAGFTGIYQYHCKGNVSTTCDKKLDELIEKAQIATGEERKQLWQAAFKRLHEEIISEVMLFHMVAYARIGKRINFKPSLYLCANEIQLAQITFK